MAIQLEDVRRALGRRPARRVSDPVTHRAAVALVLREAGEGLELLFIRRAEYPGDPWSGQMAFPGGRAEPDDRDLEVTAIRETAEEIGLDLVRAEALGPLDEVRAMARMRPMNLTIQPFVFRLAGADPELVLNTEVTSTHWLPLDALLSPQWRSTFDYVHEKTSLTFPCIHAGDNLIIWGLTYRMFLNLEDALTDRGPAHTM
jgi:8-oxo-dGTP pyrophosphatase MutT (NUDIX family)